MRKLILLCALLCAMVLLISASPVRAQNVLWVSANNGSRRQRSAARPRRALTFQGRHQQGQRRPRSTASTAAAMARSPSPHRSPSTAAPATSGNVVPPPAAPRSRSTPAPRPPSFFAISASMVAARPRTESSRGISQRHADRRGLHDSGVSQWIRNCLWTEQRPRSAAGVKFPDVRQHYRNRSCTREWSDRLGDVGPG